MRATKVKRSQIKDIGHKRLLTVKEASRLLHIHENTLRRWNDIGLIKATRLGPRGDRRFRQEDIVSILVE